jgi:hypothetical protein
MWRTIFREYPTRDIWWRRQSSKKQTINLPGPVDANSPTAADNELIRQELVKGVGKRQMKLFKLLMKAHATVYGQCSEDVKEKLEASSN